MENEGKLTHGQTVFFVYGSAAGNIVYTFTWVTFVVGRPFWLATLLGVLFNVPFAIWILFLGSYKKDGTIFDILQDGLGKIVSKFVIFIYLAINIASSVCMLNMFTGTVKVYFLHLTPSYVIMFFIVFICAIFVDSGIQNFGKLIEILAALFMVNYFIGFALSFVNLFDIKNIVPIFDTSYSQFFKGVMITAGSNAECLLLLMVTVESIPQTSKHYLSVVKGLLFWSILLPFAILIMEGDVGQELLSRVAQAGITVGSTIQIGDFVRGLEIPILITYQFFAVVKTMMFLYCCLVSAKKFLNVKKGRLLIIPVALLILIPSIWMNSFNTGYFLAVFLGSYVILPFSVLVLLLASVSAAIISKETEVP